MWKNLSLILASVIIVSLAAGATYYVLYLTGEKSDRKVVLVDTTDVTEETSDSSSAKGEAPLYIATMTHMEGNSKDDTMEDVFWQHVTQLRYGMDLADEYGAKLTIESEQPFARANTLWEHNMLQEIVDRGHGVGTHCDIGVTEKNLSLEAFTALFKENKTLVDDLVGAENNKGCSGGGSATDWVLAASQAGFGYIDGVVGFHYLAVPLKNRPDATWTDQYIRKEVFHENVPLDLEDRVYLRMLANAEDFEHDKDGVLVLSAGSLGRLDMMAEDEASLVLCEKNGSCLLSKEDVDTVVAQIRSVDAFRDRTRIAKVDIYFPATNWDEKNEDVLRYFFSEMQKLADGGVVQWATQRAVYESYMAWNS